MNVSWVVVYSVLHFSGVPHYIWAPQRIDTVSLLAATKTATTPTTTRRDPRVSTLPAAKLHPERTYYYRPGNADELIDACTKKVWWLPVYTH